MRRNGRAGAIVVGLVLTTLMLGAVAVVVARRGASSNSVAAREVITPALAFTDIALAGDGKTLDVTYDIGWTTDTFPGVYRCTWTALDPSGQSVGVYSDVYAAMGSSTPGAHFSMDVTAPASTVQPTCGDRLDIATDYGYDFSGISVSKATHGEMPAYDVTFDVAWEGEGLPGPVWCDVTLLDRKGTAVYRTPQPISFYDGEGTTKAATYIVEDERLAGTDPIDARFECRPVAAP